MKHQLYEHNSAFRITTFRHCNVKLNLTANIEPGPACLDALKKKIRGCGRWRSWPLYSTISVLSGGLRKTTTYQGWHSDVILSEKGSRMLKTHRRRWFLSVVMSVTFTPRNSLIPVKTKRHLAGSWKPSSDAVSAGCKTKSLHCCRVSSNLRLLFTSWVNHDRHVERSQKCLQTLVTARVIQTAEHDSR
jgi:hypothetical protein